MQLRKLSRLNIVAVFYSPREYGIRPVRLFPPMKEKTYERKSKIRTG